MVLIAIVSDAHLLMQAEWLEDESKITAEGNEVLENFERAIDELKKEKPEAVFLAGDIFDYRTKSQRRVAHREGEKYMIRIRAVLDRLADELNCKIYALKGNHDSEPVLRSTEKALKGKFVYHVEISHQDFDPLLILSYAVLTIDNEKRRRESVQID